MRKAIKKMDDLIFALKNDQEYTNAENTLKKKDELISILVFIIANPVQENIFKKIKKYLTGRMKQYI